MNSTYENWPAEQIERLTRERFFNAIDDPQMRGLLWSRSPRSVEEAAVMADGLEKLMESTMERRSNQAVYANKQDQKPTAKDPSVGRGENAQVRESQESGRMRPRGDGHPRQETIAHLATHSMILGENTGRF